jgi:hypothetical protein
MKRHGPIAIKHYYRNNFERLSHQASVWRELVAFRAGEMQPGAGDTSSRQTEADATAFPHADRDERAGSDEGGPERH